MPRMAAVLLLTVVFFGLATLVVVKVSPIVAGQISSVRDQLVRVTQGGRRPMEPAPWWMTC
jgi:predicted PurR-regulated permease PerM